MSKLKRNIPLLKRLRTRFLRMRHAAHFDMQVVCDKTECGSVMCIGGHALALAGYSAFRCPTCPLDEDGGKPPFCWKAPDGRELHSARRYHHGRAALVEAQKLLGLPKSTLTNCADSDWWADEKDNGLFYRFDLKTPKEAAALIQEYIDGTR